MEFFFLLAQSWLLGDSFSFFFFFFDKTTPPDNTNGEVGFDHKTSAELKITGRPFDGIHKSPGDGGGYAAVYLRSFIPLKGYILHKRNNYSWKRQDFFFPGLNKKA